MRQIQKGSVDRSVDLYIIDSTDGTPEVGVLWNTAGMDLKYRRDLSAVVSITEATLAALTTAHTDGGFLEIGNGVYRLDLPDAAWATGADHVTIFGTVTGMIVLPVTVQLVAYDPESALATPTNITAGTITTATNVTTVNGLAANTITAASIAADAITDAKVAADVTIASVTGAVGSVTGAVGSVTGAVGSVTGLTASNLDVAVSTLATAANLATVAGYIDTEIGTIITDVAAVKSDTAAILVDTGTTLDGRIPAALTAGGNMKSDALAVNGSTAAAALMAILNGATVVYQGTVTGAATTTTLVDSGLTQAADDWWKGRIIIFTSVLTLQGAEITGFTAATDTLTFTAVTSAPTGATYIII